MKEVSLFLAFGPQKTLDMYKYDSVKQTENSLSHQFVYKLGIQETPMPTCCNLYVPFLVGFSRPSNQLASLISISNNFCFAATGSQSSDSLSMKMITELIIMSSQENVLQGTHNLGSTLTRRKNDELKKEEIELNKIEPLIDDY
jgi:hypothetical protein